MKRIIVMSDSHGRVDNVISVLEKHKNAELVIFCGDGQKDIETAEALFDNIKFEKVCGNCDFFSDLPAKSITFFEGIKILFSHGHIFSVKYGYSQIINEAKKENADFCIFGHTHNQYCDYCDNIYVLNPGSIGSGNYALIDIERDGSAICIPCKL